MTEEKNVIERAKEYEQKYLIGSSDGSANYVIPKTWWWELIAEVERLEGNESSLEVETYERMERIESLKAENAELKRISGERKTQVKSLESSCSNYQYFASRGVEENNKLKAQLAESKEKIERIREMASDPDCVGWFSGDEILEKL